MKRRALLFVFTSTAGLDFTPCLIFACSTLFRTSFHQSDANASFGSSSSKRTKNEGRLESPTAGRTAGSLTCPSECVISNPTELCTDYNTYALYSNPDGEKVLILAYENTATKWHNDVPN